LRVALTGSTGFIGKRLTRRLLAHAHQLTLLCRGAVTPSADTTIVRGNLEDKAALESLVSEADAVIHLAGAVRGAVAADFLRPNVEGTRNLLDAMDTAAPGTPLLVFSSLAAREPTLSHYAASKRAAEDLVVARAASRPVLVLRPPAVYGPGDTEMLPVFRFMARTGFAPCAGHRSDRVSLIFVEDLVDAAMQWLAQAGRPQGLCTLHDGHAGGYDWDELCAIVGAACGRRVRVLELPRALLNLVAGLNPRLCALAGRKPMLSPGKLRELRHPDWSCDNLVMSSLLDWSPRTPLAEGLTRTPGWQR
jgi:nucleoside-diphosphate-sugar epimerase